MMEDVSNAEFDRLAGEFAKSLSKPYCFIHKLSSRNTVIEIFGTSKGGQMSLLLLSLDHGYEDGQSQLFAYVVVNLISNSLFARAIQFWVELQACKQQFQGHIHSVRIYES
jgi:hypothetical protein